MPFVFWEIVIPLIIAFLLGLFFGWLWWGWRRTKITYTQWETMRQKANRASSVEAEAELVELRSENERLQAEIDDHECEASVGDAELGTGVLGLSGAAALAGTDSDADEQSADEQSADEQSADEQSADEQSADEQSADEQSADEQSADEQSAATDSTEADAGIEADAGADDVGDAAAGESESDDDEAGDLHPYGDGSHAPIDDAGKEMPEGYPIKGNVDSMLYHRPDSRVYASTGAEVWFDTSQRAEDSGFALAKSHPKDTAIADADRPVTGERHPYGAGSHAPFTDDPKIMPEGYPIKGNADSMLYHREDSRSYGATIAEVWFDTPESAEAAGFGLANSHPKD